MSLIFQVRGTALNAYYARFSAQHGYAYGGDSGTAIPVVTADASVGIFGGSYIAKAGTSARALIYPGFANCPSTNTFAILMRIIPRWTGSPAGIEHLFSMSSPSSSGICKHEIMINTSGQLRVRITDQSGVGQVLATSTNAWSATSGTPVDLMVSWDGTNTSGAYKWSIDGVEVDTLTMNPISNTAPLNPVSRTAIVLGMGIDTARSNWDLNELCIYDSAESHTYSVRTGFITPPSVGDGIPTTSIVKYAQGFYTPSSFSQQTGEYGGPPSTGGRSFAPQETQIAVYEALTADSALMVLLGTTVAGTQKVFDFVKQASGYPFITLQINPWEDRGNYTHEGMQAVLTVHVWYQSGANSLTGTGNKQVQLIQKRIDELLHKRHLVVAGWSTLVARRSLIDILVEPDNVTRHGIQQFKLFLGGN
jgi:hypothetical protein